jgi:hypothetical protein
MGAQILATDFFMLMLTFSLSVSVRWALGLPFGDWQILIVSCSFPRGGHADH